MAVYRVNKSRNYTVMSNFHLRDKNLSLKAVGLLSKMLSFNDGWKFSTRGLSAICKEGPDAILSALRELERHGYLVRHRQRDSKGRLSSTIFDIFEEPQPFSNHWGIRQSSKVLPSSVTKLPKVPKALLFTQLSRKMLFFSIT